MSFQPFKQQAGDTIATLKQAVLTPNPDLAPFVRIFQELLESVGTPETVECTLDYLKEFKAQAFMYYIRAYQTNLLSVTETAHLLQVTSNEILVKYTPQEEAPTTTKLLLENDAYLSTRFKAFVDTLSNPSADSVALILSLHQEFPLDTFQSSFCKFLDQISNSLEHSAALELQKQLQQNNLVTVKLKATDLVTVIDKQELQAIHKGDDEELSFFLEQHGMKEFFQSSEHTKQESEEMNAVPVPQPSMPNSFIDIPLGDSFDYGVMHEIDTSELPSPVESTNSQDLFSDSVSKLKRRRPHEDTVDAAGKRRAVPNPNAVEWGDENAYPVPIATVADHLNLKASSFIPMREIAFPIRKPREVESTPIADAESTPRATGKTVTGQRKRRRWTDLEVDYLLEGVRLFGIGCWKDILNHFPFGDRTYVDLKDKFRNMRKHYSTDELLGKTGNLRRK